MAIPTEFRPLGGSKEKTLPGYYIFPRNDFTFAWRTKVEGKPWVDLSWANMNADNFATALTALQTTTPTAETFNVAFNRQGAAAYNNSPQAYITRQGAVTMLALVGRGAASCDVFFAARVHLADAMLGGLITGGPTGTALHELNSLRVTIDYVRSDPAMGSWMGVYASAWDLNTNGWRLMPLSEVTDAQGELSKQDGPKTITVTRDALSQCASADGIHVIIRDNSKGNTLFIQRIRVEAD